MLSGRWPLKPEDDGSFFIDRDPKAFSLVLQCLRGEKIDKHSISAEKMAAFCRDVDYYGLPAQVVDACLVCDVTLAKPERFSSDEHRASISLEDNGKLATVDPVQAYRLSSAWVLGNNSYGGEDHVLITFRIEQCFASRWLAFGVCNLAPTQPGAFCIRVPSERPQPANDPFVFPETRTYITHSDSACA